MPFGFGKNDNESSIQPLDNDDLNEIKKIQEMLNPNEEVLVVARQGIKENIVDIPYDVITSVKLEKGLLSSTIRFEAPALVGSKRLGMIHGIVSGETDNEGVI
jgi:Bacterial PH domain